MTLRSLTLAAGSLAVSGLLGIQAAQAQTIVEDWASIAVPPPPELQPVTVDSDHTALLILDMNANSCGEAKKPRCVRSIQRIQKLLLDARAHKLMVVYSEGPHSSTMPPDALKPLPAEPIVRAVADKWLGSELGQLVADRGIQTLVVTGTSGESAVLFTATGAALRNLKVVVPLDAISSESEFGELATAWVLKNSVAVAPNVTLTRSDIVVMR